MTIKELYDYLMYFADEDDNIEVTFEINDEFTGSTRFNNNPVFTWNGSKVVLKV